MADYDHKAFLTERSHQQAPASNAAGHRGRLCAARTGKWRCPLPALVPAVASLLLVLLPASAQAGAHDSITCGAQITQSITLTSNLTCTGTALTIEAPIPITVDLGGHTVTSTAAPASACRDAPTIIVTIPSRGVTVQDGRIRGNGAAVCDQFSRGNIYQNLVFDGAGWESAQIDTHPTIRDNRFINGAGVVIVKDDTVTIEDNQFLGGPADKTAIFASFNVSGTFSGNRITGYGVGLDLGDFFTFPRTVAGNTVSGAGIGIRTAAFTRLGTISGNRVAGSSGDGILIIGPAFSPIVGTISGNTAVGNGGDGIDYQLASPGAAITFADNVARGNAGHGIVAPAGAIDGGGNVASGNGTDPQCVNLVCST
jgi:Right handed beta helix region